MVDTVYKCTKCGVLLEDVTKAEAKEHENIPINGDDITGLLLSANGSYHVMILSDDITSNHERKFYPDIIDVQELERNGSTQSRIDMAIEMTRSASKIKEIMGQGQYRMLQEIDFKRISAAIWEQFGDDYQDLGVEKLIRTFPSDGKK